jgi:biopolymer transport protein ExbB
MISSLSNLALFDYFQRGGFWMWALLVCSLAALTVILHKAVSLWLAGRGASVLTAQVDHLVGENDSAAAIEACASSGSAVSTVLEAVLNAASGTQRAVREAAQVAGSRQIAVLESGLPVLSTVAAVAPLIGFLGTVSGMIRAFTAIAELGLGEPGVVAGGIGEALITTASGLIVAIPCFIAYGYFVARVNSIGLHMELAGTHLVNAVTGDGGEDAV